MRELKEIDRIILKELLKDGRKSFTAIAEECHTSKDIIWKHYKEMKKTGVIVGATIQFNYQKFGYTGVAMLMLSLESQYINDISEHFKKIPEIGCYRHYNSPYNIIVISALKDLRDLERVKELITKPSKVNELKTYLWTDVRNIPENILGAESDRAEQVIGKFENQTKKILAKIDDVDFQILEKLTANGRLPFRKVAQELGVTTDTITRRYEKLKENNFIKVSIQFNPLELGYQAILSINLALTNQSETKGVVDKLSRISGVAYLVKISGNDDLLVVALVKDCNDIIAINEEIAKIPKIKRIEATLQGLPPFWPTPRQYISTF